MDWEPIYAELANKLRWSISSTARAAGFNYSFQESMALANYAAGDILRQMKAKNAKPDFMLNTSADVAAWMDLERNSKTTIS